MNVKALVDLHSAIPFQKVYRKNNLSKNIYPLAEQMDVWVLDE